MSGDIKTLSAFVRSIAETLRGDFKQSEYGKVILPFVVLRRLDCIPGVTQLFWMRLGSIPWQEVWLKRYA